MTITSYTCQVCNTVYTGATLPTQYDNVGAGDYTTASVFNCPICGTNSDGFKITTS